MYLPKLFSTALLSLLCFFATAKKIATNVDSTKTEIEDLTSITEVGNQIKSSTLIGIQLKNNDLPISLLADTISQFFEYTYFFHI